MKEQRPRGAMVGDSPGGWGKANIRELNLLASHGALLPHTPTSLTQSHTLGRGGGVSCRLGPNQQGR